MSTLRLFPAIFLTVCLTSCIPAPQEGILIRNAIIMDGSGNPAYTGSVRIVDERIAAIGDLEPGRGDSIIDASGLVLCPGFIDTHSHHDWDTARTVVPALSQGITTIIVGQDGGSQENLESYFDSLLSRPLALNLASYVGHNTIRRQVLGADYQRRATAEEIDSMKILVRMGMEAGALGLSTGLEYDPGIYSDPEEVIELARVAAEYGGHYISHMRSEDVALESSIQELLRIGDESEIPVQISHFKLARRGLWGAANRILAILDSARAMGIEVTADVYPYEAWQSTMTVLFPKRDFDNRESATFALEELTTPEGMLISRFNAEPDYEGKTLAQVAGLRGQDPVTTYMELIRMSQEVPGESIIAKSMAPQDIETLLAWEHSNLCSDGAPRGHPRGWGAFPRFWAMDMDIPAEQKIRKMTAKAADHLGLPLIGRLRRGYYADLILFDPDAFRDRATYADPAQPAAGLKLVVVSGRVVYTPDGATGKYPGRIFRRQLNTQK